MVNIVSNTPGKGGPPPDESSISFEAVDVTASRQLDARNVQRVTPAGSVARALASRMGLPDNVPWSLRNDRGQILEDNRGIGEQLDPGERVTVTPKTHLG